MFGLYALLFTPLVFWHDTMNPLITAKTLFFQVVVEFAFAGYAALAIAFPECRPRRTGIFWGVLAFLAAVSVSAAFAVYPTRSFWSIPERMTGLFLLIHACLLFVVARGMMSRASWGRYFAASSVISFFVALIPVAQLAFPGIFFDTAAERLSGTLGNPIFLAAYLLFHIWIAGHLAFSAYRAGRRHLAFGFFAIAGFDLFGVLFTQTRGAIIGLVFGAIALSVMRFFARAPASPFFRRAVFIAWAAIALCAGAFLLTRNHPFWARIPVVSRFTGTLSQESPRLIAWRIGMSAFLDRPATGWGWENFTYAFARHYDPSLLRHGFGETLFDKPHNVFVQVLAETGAIGFAAYLFLIAAFFRAARREPWLVALGVAYFVQDFFAFDTVTSYLMLFLALAYADGIGRPDALRRAYSGPVRRLPVSAAALLLVAAVPTYLFGFRTARASNAEWGAVNEFVQRHVREGLDRYDEALSLPSPYADYARRNLAPWIGRLYQENAALPDAQARVARAAGEFREIIAHDPDYYVFRISFAEFVTTVHDADPSYIREAEDAVAHAEKLSPHRQATQYVLSKILYLKGDKAAAAAAMKSAADADPEVADPHFYYGMLLLQTGDILGAGQELDRAAALGRTPKNAAEARILGAQFGDAEDYGRSIAYFQQALLYEPADAETKVKLGLVYFFDRQYDAARNVIREVMKTQDLKKSAQYPALAPILRDLKLE